MFQGPTGILMAATFAPDPRLVIGSPRPLFTVNSGLLWDFKGDGTRFLVAVPVDTLGSVPITVVTNQAMSTGAR